MFSDGTIIKERYQIVREIARGGMGVVYLVNDLLIEDYAALKVSLWQHEQLRKAFLREAKFLVKLNHKGLPKVRDYFVEGEKQILVMDFVDGENLRQRVSKPSDCAGKGLSVSEVLGFTEQLCDILNFLHSQTPPIVHRDIKPENIKIRPDGQIVLLDFGLAKDSELSVPAVSMAYSSPEQISRTGTSPQSDIYSLGATLYYLLTGEIPTSATHRLSSLYEGKDDKLLSVHQRNPEIPLDISERISWAMEIPDKNRPRSAKEFWQSFQILFAEKTKSNESDVSAVVQQPEPLELEKKDAKEIEIKTSPLAVSAAKTNSSKGFLLIFASLTIGLLMLTVIAGSIFFVSQKKAPMDNPAKVIEPETVPQSAKISSVETAVEESVEGSITVNMFWKTRNRGEVKVAPDNIFRSGDELRLGIDSKKDGFFYLLTTDSDGNAALLYPIGDAENQLRSNEYFRLPEAAKMYFGDVKKDTGAYTVDKLYFVFTETKDEPIIQEIADIFKIASNGKKIQTEYKSGELENVKNLKKNLDELAKTSDIKSTEIKFSSTAKTIVGTFDVRSAGR